MAASTPVFLSKKSQESFLHYYKSVQTLNSDFRGPFRSRLEYIDRIYQRETNRTKEHLDAKKANKQGDAARYQDITVPVVAPQVETAVTYQTSVFLTGSPLFGVVASPEFIDESRMLEATINEQATKGGWTAELIKFFRNGFKHNFAPLEVSWDSEIVPSIETAVGNIDAGTEIGAGIPKEVIWRGNTVKALDPYNTFIDPKVDPSLCYKDGEFAGYTELYSRIKLKELIASLPDVIIHNVKDAFEAPDASDTDTGYYEPDINPDVTKPDITSGVDWFAWAAIAEQTKNIQYKGSYEVTTLYCKVLPSEFSVKVPKINTPQVYKLIIVNHSVIIYCERQTNAHNYIPILIGQPKVDGLKYQTKSLASEGAPFQEVTTAVLSSIISSKRRMSTDRLLYDPSKVSEAAINSPNPAAKIPVRPSAYGEDLSRSVYQFPFRDDNSAESMQQISQLIGMANQSSGQNQASQGQFVKGNKTLHEFDSVMNNANGRDQTTSILLEAQVFRPLKHILKINILQYQGGTSIYDRTAKKLIEVDPLKLRKAVLDFKISDGLIPSSKLMNAETFSTAIQVIGSSPQIGAGFNLPQMFSYLMKSQGAEIDAFEKSSEQIAYEQAVSSWQQTAMFAIEKGVPEDRIPPQPKPEEFNYDPSGNQQPSQEQQNDQT